MSNPINKSSGIMPIEATLSRFQSISFIIKQILGKIQTATLVKIESRNNEFVNVLPLIKQIDGQGETTPHEIVYNIPFVRLQGGKNAVIIDPQPGDIGICVFASRDITAVKTAKQQSPPGSSRRFSYSDGLYIGGLLNAAPEQYIEFMDEGIKVISPYKVIVETPLIELTADQQVKITSPLVDITADTQITGNVQIAGNVGVMGSSHGAADVQIIGDIGITGDIDVTGSVAATIDVTANNISVKSHVHTGVEPGAGTTGLPQ
jgi:hypothetical protein